MIRSISQLCVLCLGLLLTVHAGAATTVVTADRMLDVITGKVIDRPQITVTDGRISSVGTQGAPVPAEAKRIDLPGLTLLPGLIDMHVHLTSDPHFSGYRGLEFTDHFWTVIGVVNARRTLEAGFTTVRNVGSRGYDDVALKQAIEKGYIAGPRIVPATYAIGATGGHCDSTQYPPSIHTDPVNIADSPEQIRQLVRKLHKYGAEVIKLCVTGGVLSKTDAVGAQQLSLAEIQAAVEEAHMLGLKVAVHAHGTAGIKDAIRAGVDTVEHASLADEEAFQLAKQHGTYFSMDIYDDDYILAEGEKNGVFKESLDKERVIGRKQRETFRAASKAGVKMIFGTDAGVYPNGDNAKQFATMVTWGMTPLQAIQAATVTAAEALGRPGDVGAIAVGRYGDLIGVAGDPLSDVTVLQSVRFVMKGGEPVK
jgi:imidazolonepropionase-like amidohydrolase